VMLSCLVVRLAQARGKRPKAMGLLRERRRQAPKHHPSSRPCDPPA
jgi:hypothetical protein